MSQFAQLANRLITDNGRDIELVEVKNYGKSYDPTRIKDSVTVKALSTQIFDKESFGGTVQAGDRRWLISSSHKVEIDMQIIDEDTFTVYSVDEVKPGNESILYKVMGRS